MSYWDYPKYLTESEKISLILGQYGTDFWGLLAVSNRSRILNFGLGPKEIRFSQALVYAIFNDQSFNDTLFNDIISFEQLGPVCLLTLLVIEVHHFSDDW